MNINLIVKKFKKTNGYTNRGNVTAANSIMEYINTFQNFVNTIHPLLLDRSNLNKKQLVDACLYINSWKPTVINIDDFKHQDILDINFNICFVQNEKQRSKFDIINQAPSIIFDRTDNNKNYSNGFNYSKKTGKTFFPRFNGKYYPGERLSNSVGIYFRPDVCPAQHRHIMEVLRDLDGKVKDLDTKPIIVGYGKEQPKFNNLEYIHTTDQSEFFSTIETYLYSPMEIADPMPNTLVEAILNKANIVILENDSEVFSNGSINEIESYLNYLKKLQIKKDYDFFTWVTPNNFIEVIGSCKKIGSKDEKEFASQLIKGLINFSEMYLLTQIFNSFEKNYTCCPDIKKTITELINVYISELMIHETRRLDWHERILAYDDLRLINDILYEIVDSWLDNF